MDKIYFLKDVVLNKFVSHVSFTAFGALVSCTDYKLAAIPFSYDHALILRDYLQCHVRDCFGYEIVSC